jgi:demethylmenaquinone methyltransferase/2-methoxy-6-polyprenyl-1,4-benzoquinol methylase
MSLSTRRAMGEAVGREGVEGGSGQMFDRIAARYDLLNRMLSMGVDRLWRRRTVRALQMQPGHRVLDLATGTGDMALQAANQHAEVEVVGLDPSRQMLAVGLRKVERQGLGGRISLKEGDAQSLPFADQSFDRISMAFGIRNVPDRSMALREMARVLRPGGRVGILELSEPRNGLLSALARFHIHTVVPRLGALLSGASEYRYLERSIAAFPSTGEFARQMGANGLQVLEVIPLTFGVVCLYVAGLPEGSS